MKFSQQTKVRHADICEKHKTCCIKAFNAFHGKWLVYLDGNLAGAETIIGGLVSKLMVCSALRRCFIFSHNLRAPSRQCKPPHPRTHMQHNRLPPFNPLLSLFLMHTHSCNQCQASSHSLKLCMGQNRELTSVLFKRSP